MIAQLPFTRVVLELEKKNSAVREFEAMLSARIVGQDEAVSQLVSMYQTVLAGMTVPERPIANLLFLGPTGSGKTRIVEAAAEILLGNSAAMIKVDCAEFQHSHEIAKLVGSPPGYLGHRETLPVLTQHALDQFQNEKVNFTFVLFDEIEKASDALWQLLLGILDKGTLTLGDNQKVDFSRAVVAMTSNLGAVEMGRLISGPIGFAAPAHGASGVHNIHREIHCVAVEAAKRRFSPEFMNRIDRVLVFRPLAEDDLRKILDIELNRVQRRIMASQGENRFILDSTREAKDFLMKEGTDTQYGARHLRRAIEHHLVIPLSSLIASGQIAPGDDVVVDCRAHAEALTFSKTLKVQPPAAVGHLECPTRQTTTPVAALKSAKTSSAHECLLESIVEGKNLLNLRKGAKLFSQGAKADGIYFIQTGKVRVTVVSAQGKEVVLATLDPGDFLGEECLVGDSLRTSTATSVEPSTVFRIEKRAMLQALHVQPALSEEFVASLLARNVNLEEDLGDQLFNRSEKRLARVLLKLSRFGQDDKLPDTKVPRLTHSILAEIVGTTSSKVSLFMNKFRMLGLIDDKGDGDITVRGGLLTEAILED